MQITRKEFLGRLIQGAAGLAGIAMVVGCGSSTSGDPTPDASSGGDAGGTAACATNGTVSTIESNHGHVLIVSKADVTTGAQKSYDITGTADHPHTVTVTVDMFARLKGNTSITMASTTDDGHSHGVIVMCA